MSNGKPVRRLPILLLVPLVLAGLAAAERVPDDDSPSLPEADAGVTTTTQVSTARQDQRLMPVTSPSGSLLSTWFCAGGTAVADGEADHTVILANSADQTVQAAVTVVAGSLDSDPEAAAIAARPPVTERVELVGHGQIAIRLADVSSAPFASALVEVAGGDVAVEHSVTGPRGFDVAPCASAPSDSWYFPAGSTSHDARELIVLFNPFPDDAVVDLTFATTGGIRAPQPYDGYIVPGGAVVALQVSDVVARHEQVSTSIVARRGRVVADRIESFDGSAGRTGLTIGLGAPEPAGLWFFPDGEATDGLTEAYTLFNPGDSPAEADLEIQLDDPETNGEVEPIAVSVPPGGYSVVVMNEQERLPAGIGHAVTARVQNGVNVVVERTLLGSDRASRRELAYTMGSPLASTAWLLAGGAETDSFDEAVVLQNPSSDTISRVSVEVLVGGRSTSVDELQDTEVQPAGRAVLLLAGHVNGDEVSLLVTATTPVVVERRLVQVHQRGLAQTMGIPLSNSIVRLEPLDS